MAPETSFRPFRLAGHGVVVQHQRVQVPVAGVEDVRDPDAGLGRQLGDPGQDVAERGARHHAVLHDVGGGEAPDRGERRLAAGPDPGPLRRVVGRPDLPRARPLADGADGRELRLDLGGGPVQLDEQDRRRALRVAAVHRGLGRLDGQRVHHLDRGGHDSGAR